MPQSATVASTLDRSLDGLHTSVDEVVVETGLFYVRGRPVQIDVRKRDLRHDMSDAGTAVTPAGHPDG